MQIVGGYTLVRLLGTGGRAEVFLGRTSTGVGPTSSSMSTAAIKLFRPEAPRESIDTEIDVLARLSQRHLLRLDDLTLSPSGAPALILQRLDPRPLSRVLIDRGELSPGEVVSILAPIATAVQELHRSGVAHRRLRSAAVLFDESGAPVISGFGRAAVIGPLPATPDASSVTPAALADDIDVRRDIVDLCVLAKTVAEASPPSLQLSRLLDWVDEASSSCPPHRLPAELAQRVFELGPASPVDLSGARPKTPSRMTGADISPAWPTRAGTTPSTKQSEERADTSTRLASPGRTVLHAFLDRARFAVVNRLLRAGHAFGLGEIVSASLGRVARVPSAPSGEPRGVLDAPGPGATSRSAVVHGMRRFFAPVRRSVWITGALSVALLMGALVVVPEATGRETSPTRRIVSTPPGSSVGGGGAPRPAPEEIEAARPVPASDTTPGTTTSGSATLDSGTSGSEVPEPEASGAGRAKTDTPDAATTESDTAEITDEESLAAIHGDDPESAATALLTLRSVCLDDGDTNCLDQIDQPDSAAMDADAYLIDRRSAEADGLESARRVAGGSPVLVQRLGDSAILTVSAEGLTTPASLLLVRSEAGWRIRDLILQ